MSFTGFWDKLGSYLAKAAVWAASNPQVIVNVVATAVAKK